MAQRASGKKKSGKRRLKGAVAKLPARTKSAKGRKRRGIGDNSGDHAVPDETILRAINTLRGKKRAMEKVQEELDQARGVYRAARKAADKDGLNLKAFDIVEKLEKMDQGAVLIDHADAGRYLKLTDSPLATQMDLFQNLSAPAPVVDVAMQGLNAGKGGEPIDNNPHQPGSDDFELWAKNHAAGVKQATEALTRH